MLEVYLGKRVGGCEVIFSQLNVHISQLVLVKNSVCGRQTDSTCWDINFYTVVPTYKLEVILLVIGHSIPYLDQYATMPLMKTNTLLLQVDRVMQNALSLFKKETEY